jgi:hypothetical protein
MEGHDLALLVREEPRSVQGRACEVRTAVRRLLRLGRLAGYTAKGDPNHWKIVGGKLFLNYDAKVQRDWEQDIPGHITNANRNWPKVLEK